MKSAVDKNPLELILHGNDSLNLAFQQNAIPVVQELRLRNSGEDRRELLLRITAEPPFAEPLEIRVESLAKGAEFFVSPLELKLNPAYLEGLTEKVRGQLRIECLEGAEPAVSQVKEISVMARNEWCGLVGLPEILAAFVVPNDPAVMSVLDGAAKVLKAEGGGVLNGYQDKSPKRVVEQLAAIHAAMVAMGIRYISPPASFETTGQKVRFPSDIKAQRFGTCLDLALMVAACCEQAGLHPLVLMHEGHAYAGCWLAEDTLAEPAVDDLQMLRKLVELGEVVVWEATAVTEGTMATFAAARALAEPYLKTEKAFRVALDVRRSRTSRILPLSVVGGEVEAVTIGGDAKTVGLETGEIPMASGQAALAVGKESPGGRIDQWKSRLLDLTLRNRLLNFKETKGVIPILAANSEHVEDALIDGDLKLMPVPRMMGKKDPRSAGTFLKIKKTDPVAGYLKDQLEKKILHTALEEVEHSKRLLDLYRASRTSLEENGVNTLYAAVGILEWRESKQSERVLRAPLLLVPVELKRKSLSEGFILKKVDEEPRTNTTLLEMLRQNFKLEISGLEPLPEDDSGVDAKGVLQIVKKAVRDMEGWEVKSEVWLSQFSFSKFLLWKDLTDRLDALLQNRVVSHLVNNSSSGFPNTGEEIQPHELDERFSPKEVFCPRSADSSQLAAVMAAAAGQDFVLEGPPGTGKSQTISNIIAHCMAEGKRVLFVAEKRTALDVVYNRLKEEGLEAFCLQLHSNKTGKTEVLAQFKSALELGEPESVSEWNRSANDLERSRNKLNEYVLVLHTKSGGGLSAYDCIGYLASRGASDFVNLQALGDPTQITQEKLQGLAALCAEMEEAAGDAEGVPNHPLSEIGLTEWSPSSSEELLRKIQNLRAVIADFKPAVQAVSAWMKAPEREFSIFELYNMHELGSSLLELEAVGADMVLKPWSEVGGKLASLRSLIEERNGLRKKLAQFDEEALLKADPSSLERQWNEASSFWPAAGMCSRFSQRMALANLSKNRSQQAAQARAKFIHEFARVVPNTVFTMLGNHVEKVDAEMVALLAQAKRLQEICRDLESEKSGAIALLGALWHNGEPVVEDMLRAVGWAEALQKHLLDLAGADLDWLARLRELVATALRQGPDVCGRSSVIGAMLLDYTGKLSGFMNGFNDLANDLVLDRATVDASPGHLQALEIVLSRFESHWQRIRMWSAWRAVRANAIAGGLNAIVAKFECGETAPLGSMAELLERSFRKKLLHTLIEKEPLLRDFKGTSQNSSIEAFRKKDEQIAELTKRVIDARLRATLSKSKATGDPSGGLGLLRHEIAKKTRHIPVRKLLKGVQDLLPVLKPCFLMSPLSVAQYLDPELTPFDLVIFDEASQIPVWDSVGAIARGKQLIVVGDPKQLPPTNFFARKADSDADADEDSVQEDLESILDELMSAGMRHKRLQWHYRSRHEGLIAFSNRRYYENDLLTFPSPFTGLGGVVFRHIPDGCYDHGKSRTNRIEAEALVDELVKRLSDRAHSKYSYGVVTFSMAQQMLIEGLLEERRRAQPELEKFFTEAATDGVEPVFIKNLENVQGDERDVIFFSICYGPDASGKVSMNFGPLTRSGGERRLNVAITRARQEIVIFSTLRGDQINLARTQAAGVRDLKHFLDFAERGGMALMPGASTTPAMGADFELLVAESIRQEGFEVHHQVGCSGYRIDLAVVHPRKPGRYLLGIECDGATYQRAKTARDRDKLRQAVLEGLGWKLHRIWSTDWWHDPEKQIRHLKGLLSKL